MKLTDFSNNVNYKRKSDGKIFKKENENYFVIENKKWVLTEDLKISDVFEKTHEGNIEYNLKELYNLYKSTDITQRDRYLDRFMLEVARRLDGDENEG